MFGSSASAAKHKGARVYVRLGLIFRQRLACSRAIAPLPLPGDLGHVPKKGFPLLAADFLIEIWGKVTSAVWARWVGDPREPVPATPWAAKVPVH